MSSTNEMFPKRNMSAQAIRKREYRQVERERKRERTFISAYLEIKYPDTYKEIKGAYKEAVDRYPGSTDITKTYHFRKWSNQILGNRRGLMTPQLPILTPLATLQQQQHQSPPPVPEPHQSPPPVPEPQRVIETQPSESKPSPETQPSESEPPPETQPSESEPPPEIQDQPPVPTETRSNVVSGLTLQEMEITASEVVKALQSDRELMDLIESFDLPDGVWDNELAVPDYVLQSDLEW